MVCYFKFAFLVRIVRVEYGQSLDVSATHKCAGHYDCYRAGNGYARYIGSIIKRSRSDQFRAVEYNVFAALSSREYCKFQARHVLAVKYAFVRTVSRTNRIARLVYVYLFEFTCSGKCCTYFYYFNSVRYIYNFDAAGISKR